MPDHKAKRRKLSSTSELSPTHTREHDLPTLSSKLQAFSKHASSKLPTIRNSDYEHVESVSNVNRNIVENEEGATTIEKPENSKSEGSLPHQNYHTPRSEYGASRSATFHTKTKRLLEAMKNPSIQEETRIETLLRKLKLVIEETPEQEPTSVDNAEKSFSRLHRTAVPFKSLGVESRAQYKLGYAKPSMVNVVGSYALKTAELTSQAIMPDLAIVMPLSLFSEKDYLNHRYLHKRAFYLACVATHINKTMMKPKPTTKYTYLHGNPLLPILLVHYPSLNDSPDSNEQDVSIRILPTIRENVFPLQRTLPDRNCLRGRGSASATPFYNATIRSDVSIVAYLKLLHRTSVDYPSFRNGCLLGRAWLQKRGLESTALGGGFGNFEWMTVMAILLQTGGPDGKPVFLSTYDGIQLFRSMLQFLARRDLSTKPLYTFDATGFDLNENPMFFDGKRCLNLLYKMTPVSYRALRKEAQISLQTLNNKISNDFESLFGSCMNEPFLRYDMIANVPLAFHDQAQLLGQDKPFLQEKALEVHSYLSRGLGDRILELNVKWVEPEPWALELAEPPHSETGKLVALMAFDAQNAGRVLDRGPSAEDTPECAAFKEFWGEKTELRRFKDGVMNYSILWSEKDPAPLVKEICQWIITRHLDSSTSKLLEFYYLSSLRILSQNEARYVAASDQIRSAYKDLEETIRSLRTLPLGIRSFQPSSSLLTSTSLRNPLLDTNFTPADIVVQLESSGQWPDDLRAIQMTKLALLLRLADLLLSADTSDGRRFSCHVGLENPHSDILNRSFLDVTHVIGVTFRIRLHHERESSLLEKHVADKSLTPNVRESSAKALASYRRTFIKRPMHTQAISRIVNQFPAFPGTVRLLRTWFSSHLLSTHVNEELIELLAANIFIQPEPFPRPATPILGFLRSITFLSSWDWIHNPLVIDFASISGPSMKDKVNSEICTQFEAWRAIDPTFGRVAMIAATDFDTDGTTWTAGAHPTRLVASRMIGLARSAYRKILASGLQLNLNSLFVPNLKDYDFVLHVSPSNIIGTRKMQHSSDTKRIFKNLHSSTSKHAEIMGSSFFVQKFVNDIENLYSNALVLFHSGADYPESNMIAGIWNPSTDRERWKASLGFTSIPLGLRGRSGVKLDTSAVLNEIVRIGGCILSSVEHHDAPCFE